MPRAHIACNLHLARLTAGFALAGLLAGCATSGGPSLADANRTLQADAVQTLSFSGTGRWFQFGQAPAPGLPWPAFAISRYQADIDFSARAERVQQTRRQLVEAGRERPAPVDQSVDQYVAAGYAWNRQVVAANAQALPAATAQPAAVVERAAEIWSTPQGFIKAALANGAIVKGNEVSFTVDGKWRYVGWLNAAGQVERVQTWVPTPVLGDTLIETRFEGWRDFNGIPFPGRILRSEGGHPVLDLQVSEVKVGAVTGLDVPQNVREAKATPITVNLSKLADGVHYVTGGTHHSVVIEQRDHLVLVEAPLSEERSQAVLARLKAEFPNKPVRSLINTHAHFDHSGGLRTLVAEGATIVTAEPNRAFYEAAWAAPRTLEPDQLAKSPRTPTFQTFRNKLVINDGSRAIEIYEIAGNGHNDAFALVYLPQSKVLVQADAYTPLAADAPRPTSLNPYTVNLYQNVERLKLDVVQVAALHGPGVVTVAELRGAAGVAVR